MPTALDLAANLTGATVTEGQAKTWFTTLRAALAEMGDPMGRPGALQNLSLAFSVASNALTCNVKTRAGATASATDPAAVAIRDATLTTGDFFIRNISAALSLVISSGSTLGHKNATAGDIFWYVIDNAGTLELAASTTYFGQQGIVSTIAEGGAGAADSATVMYSATARSNVAFRCVGHTIDTQTTAGTWTAVPSTSELAPFDVPDRLTVGLTDGASIAWDLGAAPVASVTLGGNRTLSNPTNMRDGSTYLLRVTQDGTGGRTLAYGGNYKWEAAVAPVLSTAAGALDILSFTSDGTNMYGAMFARDAR